MSDRKYYKYQGGSAALGTMPIRKTVTRKEKKTNLFGKTREVEITRTETAETAVPLLFYLEDGKMHEFFSGEIIEGNGAFSSFGYIWFHSDVIPAEKARSYGAVYCETAISRRNTYTLNATQFAHEVETWMPYKDEIVQRILDRQKRMEEKYLKDTAQQEAERKKALSEEEKSEAWLDAMIKKGKF